MGMANMQSKGDKAGVCKLGDAVTSLHSADTPIL